ncbi:MAG: hypothetical protein ACR2KX_12125 [Chitinophagaceae bacterium]
MAENEIDLSYFNLFVCVIIASCDVLQYLVQARFNGFSNSDTLSTKPSAAKDTRITIFPNNAPPIKDTLLGQIATGIFIPKGL